MSVKGPYQVVHLYIGASTDTKPTEYVAIGDEFFETNTRLWYVYDGSAWHHKVTAASGSDVYYESTDPAVSAAVSTTIVDAYGGVLITLTGVGNAQTIQNPTIVTAGKQFTVVNNNTSSNSIVVNGITVDAGKAQSFMWEGTVWIPLDLGITALPVPVVQGGSGRVTGTTAFTLIATGTTATGAQQSLTVGAITEILVGGGAAALPVWTTATGSGAPVRSTSPDIVAPTITNDEIVKAVSGNITADEMKGQIINTRGQVDDITFSLAAAFEGANFTVVIGTAVVKYVRTDPNALDSIYKDGITAGDGKYVGFASAVIGYAIRFDAFNTGAGVYDWLVTYIGPLISE